MTTIQKVTEVLTAMSDNDLAREWLNNDIIKKKIANAYDAWMSDAHDHKLPLTLEEYIETCLDEPEKIIKAGR